MCYVLYRSVSNDIPLSDKGQSSTPPHETAPSVYEEIPASSSGMVEVDYEYVQNKAYVTTTVSESGRGNQKQ